MIKDHKKINQKIVSEERNPNRISKQSYTTSSPRPDPPEGAEVETWSRTQGKH